MQTVSQLGGRVILGLALAALSATLLTLAFPPYDGWFLIWIGFVPMLVAQYRILPRKLSSLAPALAVGGWLGFYILPIFGGTGSFMVWLPFAIGAITILTDRNNRAFHARTNYRWFVLHGAVGWVGLEMVRSFIPIMGTWAFVAYTLYAQTWLIQPVSVFSIFCLSLVIMLVNYSLALGALAVLDQRWQLDAEGAIQLRQASRWMITAGLILGAWILLSRVLDRPATMPTVRVAALHYDAGRPRGQGGDKFIAQTREAAQLGARFIVWPEIAIDYDPQVKNTEALRALATETDAYLTIGYMVRTSPTSHRNEATVLSPQGKFLGVYGKEHPTLMMGETNTSLGTHPVYPTPLGRLATIICYDLDFTDTARTMARNGAQIVAVPSLDDPSLATKHYTHLIFRAIENRVPMIKSDSTGSDSVIIDAYGRIVAKAIAPQNEAVLVADVPLGTGDAPIVFLGDWIGWLSLAGLVIFAILAMATKEK